MWKCPKCAQKVDDAYEICWKCGTTADGVEDPDFLDEGNVGKRAPAAESDIAPESLVTLINCSLPGQAHAIRMRLENEGIPVFLFDEFTITMDWLLSNAIGGVKVQVPEPYLEHARTIMDIVEDEQEAAVQAEEHEDAHGEESGDESGEDGEPGEGAEGSAEEGIADLEHQDEK